MKGLPVAELLKSANDMDKRLQSQIKLHVALWVALTVASYVTAGPFSFASCWLLLPAFFPPLAAVIVLFAVYSVTVLLGAAFRPAWRVTRFFSVAVHGAVLIVGLVVARLAAYASAGWVSCL
jgi:hypothetical protein